MIDHELKKALEKLYQQIEASDPADQEAKEKLINLKKDIEAIINQPEESSSEQQHDLLHKLNESVQHFETSHQTLTDIMRNVINILNSLGI